MSSFYEDFAEWWPLMSAVSEYEEEATFYRNTLLSAVQKTPQTLLELGCGGGNNAFYLKAHYALTLTDLSHGMLEVSRALNPECEYLQGDMRTLRIDRKFDLVFVHDAISFLPKRADVEAAIETAFLHCAPGGAALFAPDYVKETFRPTTDCGGHDAEGRSLRWLEWVWDPDPADETYVAEYVYAFHEGEAETRVLQERHVEGAFPRDFWLDSLRRVGFEPTVVPLVHSEIPDGQHEVFACRKPA